MQRFNREVVTKIFSSRAKAHSIPVEYGNRLRVCKTRGHSFGGWVPRINVEDLWWDDPRRAELSKIVHDADGCALRFWRLAQNYYRLEILVPTEIYDRTPGASEFESVGLAYYTESGVYIRGQDHHFSWLRDRSRAGERGGKTPKKLNDTTSKQTEANGSKTKQVEASSSSSSSSSNTKKTKRVERSPSAQNADAFPPLVDLWNIESGSLPKVMGCKGTRKKQTETRWRENPDPEYWRNLIRRLTSSAFCCGKNDRGWKADFDFLIRPDTQARIMEGKYDDRIGHAAQAEAQKKKQIEELDRQIEEAKYQAEREYANESY